MIRSETFDDFYERHFASLTTIVAGIVGSRAIGEELAQEALAKALMRWEHVRTLDHRDGWVRRVAINLALSECRRVRRAADLTGRIASDVSIESAHEPSGATVTMAQIRRSLDLLTPPQRVAVVAVAVDGASAHDVADLLGCSAATARVHLHHGRRALRVLLDPTRPDHR